MKTRIIYFLFYYVFWFLAFLIQKPIFMLSQWTQSSQYAFADWVDVPLHGIPMDLSTAGYFSIPVFALLLVSCFVRAGKWLEKSVKAVSYFLLLFAAVAIVFDMFLYPYWGFRLDITPLFYLESPKNAAASSPVWQMVACGVSIAVLFLVLLFSFRFVHKRVYAVNGRSFISFPVFAVVLGVLFLAIRGGVTVSTMNVGRVYYSHDMFLNHSAINPLWNFFNSLSKDSDFSAQYRFMDEAEARNVVAGLYEPTSAPADTLLLDNKRPNIIFFILESFGSNVCEVAGGVKGLTPNLDRMAREGVFFSNFYANSFRTDRGLVSILSAYPGQPVTSLMKFPEKSQNVPTLPAVLKRNGYDLSFFYGGDENFTNMRSYLLHAGFEKRICDKDFSGNELSTKWGAYDHFVINKLIEDLKQPQKQPFCKVLLTLNSHEPFDVPSHKFADPYENSVAYTDSCLGVFYEYLKSSPYWDNTLFILMPDHARPHPMGMINQEAARYKAPMIWTGGVVKGGVRIDNIGSQIDFARTLLAQLDIDGGEFVFSKNILNKKSPKFAFYTYNDGFGFIDSTGKSIYDCAGNLSLWEDNPLLTVKGKAFLQCLMDDLDKR